jgi:myo-inositol 2-dehydrogenase / D-chiro-inositol 1-dehydrogenase
MRIPLDSSDRRQFLKTASGTVGAALVTGFPAIISAQTVTKAIKVGLVGCGGRGTGAASQALHADDYAELIAVADVDQSRVDTCLGTLGKIGKIADRVKVEKSNQFLGLDAYKKVLDSGIDVVLLATPPGFRPTHLAAGVEAGKNIFCEKPVSTDAPGIRSVLETVEKAKSKNISLVAGFCWRYNQMIQETVQQVQNGAIGKVVSYFVYLCGDSIVEQAVHSADKIAWLMQDQPPVSCVGVGGRAIPAEGGNIYDHFEVNYIYPNGVRAFLANRQIEGCYNENADYILGTEGSCTIGRGPVPRIEGKTNWTWSGEKYDMYQREHDVLFASIRKGQPVNDGKRMATSTLLAMMGRMAAYTGQQITWDQALNSQEKLFPDHLDWNGSMPVPPRAQPGITKFV